MGVILKWQPGILVPMELFSVSTVIVATGRHMGDESCMEFSAHTQTHTSTTEKENLNSKLLIVSVLMSWV